MTLLTFQRHFSRFSFAENTAKASLVKLRLFLVIFKHCDLYCYFVLQLLVVLQSSLCKKTDIRPYKSANEDWVAIWFECLLLLLLFWIENYIHYLEWWIGNDETAKFKANSFWLKSLFTHFWGGKKQLSDFHTPLTLVIYDCEGRSKNFRLKRGRNGKNFTTKESKNFLFLFPW